MFWANNKDTDIDRKYEAINRSSAVSEYVGNAASAVNQQGAATDEISASTQQASAAVTEISNRIRRLSAA